MPVPLIEICVEGIDGLLAAQQGGADRAELCASLAEGGITPSAGTIRAAASRGTIPFTVMIRPRGGDFLYSEPEFASMLDDIAALKETGAYGAVIGCLTPNGDIDEARTAALVAAAHPLKVTFHRAFDMTRDPEAALEALIRCNIDRVLTSGQQPDAIRGIKLLRQFHEQAANRIIILGCGALTESTIGQVCRQTGLTELHFSAPTTRASDMRFRNPHLTMGAANPEREYQHQLTNPTLVAQTIRAARVGREGA